MSNTTTSPPKAGAKAEVKKKNAAVKKNKTKKTAPLRQTRATKQSKASGRSPAPADQPSVLERSPAPESSGEPVRAPHSDKESAKKNKPASARSRGWWYPWIFVGGFALVLLVNAIMIWVSKTSFSGLTAEHPYEDGLSYNREIALDEAQKALGWTGVFMASARPGEAEPASRSFPILFDFVLVDPEGFPLNDMTVTLTLQRSGESLHDGAMRLDPIGSGQYALLVPLPRDGKWDASLVAARGDDAWRLRQTLIVRSPDDVVVLP